MKTSSPAFGGMQIARRAELFSLIATCPVECETYSSGVSRLDKKIINSVFSVSLW
jgi:hypothetical protein